MINHPDQPGQVGFSAHNTRINKVFLYLFKIMAFNVAYVKYSIYF